MNVVILDNATWHVTTAPNWDFLIPFFLPAYSPDLNPIEKLWLHLKKTYFYLFATATKEEFPLAINSALKSYMTQPLLCKSICSAYNG